MAEFTEIPSEYFMLEISHPKIWTMILVGKYHCILVSSYPTNTQTCLTTILCLGMLHLLWHVIYSLVASLQALWLRVRMGHSKGIYLQSIHGQNTEVKLGVGNIAYFQGVLGLRKRQLSAQLSALSRTILSIYPSIE